MLSPKQKHDYLAEHLPHESGMLEYTYRRLSSTSGVEFNAFLESFCIHARNLKLFLTNDEDVRACDFVQSFRERVGDLAEAFNRLNEQIAHLSTKRQTLVLEKFSTADATRIFSWLVASMSKFLGELPPADCEVWASALKVATLSTSPSATNAVLSSQTTTSLVAGMIRVGTH